VEEGKQFCDAEGLGVDLYSRWMYNINENCSCIVNTSISKCFQSMDYEIIISAPQHPMKTNLYVSVLKYSLMMIKGNILQQHFLWRVAMFHLFHTIWRMQIRTHMN
jgi:hypothetical protein